MISSATAQVISIITFNDINCSMKVKVDFVRTLFDKTVYSFVRLSPFAAQIAQN